MMRAVSMSPHHHHRKTCVPYFIFQDNGALPASLRISMFALIFYRTRVFVATCSLLTESLAFLRSCSSSPNITAAGSTTSFSKHAEPREELFCWYMISWDTGSLGLPCAVSSGLLPVAPEAAPSRGWPPPLVPGTASPPRDFLSPSKGADVEEQRFGWDDENTRSSCFFFLLNIHNPDSFLLPSAPPAPRRSDPSFGLSQGLVFSWKFFHILRW